MFGMQRSLPRAFALGLTCAICAVKITGCVLDFEAPFACSGLVGDGGECGPACVACLKDQPCTADAACAPLSCVKGKCWFTPRPVWTRIASPTLPPARYSAAMAPEPGGHLILFGGFGTTDARTWRLVGNEWTDTKATGGPSWRFGSGMAHDPTHGRTYLYGGYDDSHALAESWIWTGTAWMKEGTTGHPRFYAPMALDAVHSQPFLFGGLDGSSTSDNTMLSRGDTGVWTQFGVGGAPNRYGISGAMDTARNSMVLFGGTKYSDAGPITGSTTWELAPDGQKITTIVSPGDAPSARADAAMAYDEGRRVVVLFGGRDQAVSTDYQPLDQTWEYHSEDGKSGTWTRVDIPGPSKRFRASMAWDPSAHRVVLFGGTTGLAVGHSNETWAYSMVATPCQVNEDCGTLMCWNGTICCEDACSPAERCDTPEAPGRCVIPSGG